HKFNELRPDLSLKLFLGNDSPPRSQIFHWAFGAPPREFFVAGRQLPVRLALSADRFLQPFHQCRFSRSEHRRDWQLAPITVLLAQQAEISRTDAIEHTRHGQRPSPPIVFAHKSATERHTFCRRFRFPFFAKIQHLDHSAPDEPCALIGHPKSTWP